MNVRVAYDAGVFALQEYGGISRYFCKLVEAFEGEAKAAGMHGGSGGALGIEACIVAPLHINRYLAALPPRRVIGCQMPRLPKTGRLVRGLSPLLAAPVIAAWRPDVLHHTYYPRRAWQPARAASVVTVYDMIHEYYPALFPRNDTTVHDKRTAVLRADRVICISESTRRDLLALVPVAPDKVSVIHLGAEGLTAPTAARVASDAQPYLLYVGQRGGYKNFEGLLRAYAASSRLRRDYALLCFGGGPFTINERRAQRELRLPEGAVQHRAGGDDELARAYYEATVFVYPSLYEGFGIPPLEAMSVGCPVICARTSSLPEVAGTAAEYFEPDHPESLSAALHAVADSPQRSAELRALGRQRCREFSWRRCAEQTAAIYRGLT